MTEEVFSQREGYAAPTTLKPFDYLSPWVRESTTNSIGDLVLSTSVSPGIFGLNIYPLFRPYIWKVLGIQPPNSPMGGPFKYYIPAVLDKCPWYEFYDILEQIFKQRFEYMEEKLKEFSLNINAIFARDGIAWKLEKGRIVRVLDPKITKQIKEVSALLADPRFKGPDEQYEKALGHLNRRPIPDEENCAKDAIGALEGVANIIVGKTGKQLNELLKKEPQYINGIHPTIREAIDKVYAYRGVTPGVSHAQIGPATMDPADAIWVLAFSSATILYLVEKFSRPSP